MKYNLSLEEMYTTVPHIMEIAVLLTKWGYCEIIENSLTSEDLHSFLKGVAACIKSWLFEEEQSRKSILSHSDDIWKVSPAIREVTLKKLNYQ